MRRRIRRSAHTVCCTGPDLAAPRLKILARPPFSQETAMPRHALILLSLLVTILAPVSEAAESTAAPACPGISADLFDQRVPQQVRRYAFAAGMLEPFVRLWHAAERPEFPVRPEKVTIYDLPMRPLLIGYQSGDCMIAFLSVDRPRFLRWLRPQLGWSI
jgi:hypothetical protein